MRFLDILSATIAGQNREIARLRALLEIAYDGLLNHHLHDDEERDDITNKIAAALPAEVTRRVAFGDEQKVDEK
jgi:hypothetical protein